MKRIRDIKFWPPGAIMVFDNRSAIAESSSGASPHFGFGVVVANDGRNRIQVLWDAKCSRQYLTYDVTMLNPRVICRLE